MSKRILLAEDDRMSRDSMERILCIYGYEVTTANDGRAVLEILFSDKNPSRSFDLLISDERMPNLTGRKLIAELIHQNIYIPTLLMTGFGGEQFEEEAMRLGVKGILYKPIDQKTLISMIEKATGRFDETEIGDSNGDSFRDLK